MSNGAPPIESAPVPPSIPGIPQPVIVSGGESLPPSFPLGSAGTWLPPPQVGMGGNAPFSPSVVVPAPVPPSTAGFPQPQYKTGSGTVPTAASLFPQFTTNPPLRPIVYSAVQPPPPVPLPLPTTPGGVPITVSTAPNIPQRPWMQPPPSVTVAPTIAVISDLVVGSTLGVNNGTWANSGTYTRYWLRNGAQIAGEYGNTHLLVTADVGAMISAVVTSTGPGGSTSAMSNSVGPITATLADEPPVSRETHAPKNQKNHRGHRR